MPISSCFAKIVLRYACVADFTENSLPITCIILLIIIIHQIVSLAIGSNASRGRIFPKFKHLCVQFVKGEFELAVEFIEFEYTFLLFTSSH